MSFAACAGALDEVPSSSNRATRLRCNGKQRLLLREKRWIRAFMGPINLNGLGPMPPFEGEFRDSGFIKFAQSLFHHAIVLLLGSCSQRQVQSFFLRQTQRDAGILCGM